MGECVYPLTNGPGVAHPVEQHAIYEKHVRLKQQTSTLNQNQSMDHSELARENSRKLDQILQLLEGSENSPGLISRVANLEHIMFGRDYTNGLVQKVSMMWKIHVWILCTLSAGAGVAGTKLVDYLAK